MERDIPRRPRSEAEMKGWKRRKWNGAKIEEDQGRDNKCFVVKVRTVAKNQDDRLQGSPRK